MLLRTLKCACGETLEIAPKSLRDIAAIAKANDWKIIGLCSREGIAALCPICRNHQAEIEKIQ